MTVAIALGASAIAGSAIGVVVAAAGSRGGMRPRRALQERRAAAIRLAPAFGLLSAMTAAFATGAADGPRVALGATCVGTALLIAVATWVLLVEPDDGGEVEPPEEPEWWPAFERDLDEWTRRSRSLTGSGV